MKYIVIIFLFVSSVCIGQGNSVPKTRLDTLKIAVYNDSVNAVSYLGEFRNFAFKKLKTAEEYEYLKGLIDSYYDEKKKIWQQILNQK